MSRVKNQHYVPQSYLRRFSYDKDHIWVFDKVEQRVFNPNVRNVASERYFNDFAEDLVEESFQNEEIRARMHAQVGEAVDLEIIKQIIKDQLMEKSYFTNVETGFSEVCDALLRELSLTRQGKGAFRRKLIFRPERETLAFCAFVQMMRTKEFREWTREFHETIGNLILREIMRNRLPEESPDDYFVVMRDEVLPFIQANILLDPGYAEQYVEALTSHIWMLGVNETATPLYTSDNPVVRHPHVHHPLRGNAGLLSPGIEIVFPISSRVVLIMRERTYFKRQLLADGRAIALTDADVRYYNTLQVLYSRRQVYCAQDSFDLVRDVIRRYPQVCAEDRPRINLNWKGGA